MSAFLDDLSAKFGEPGRAYCPTDEGDVADLSWAILDAYEAQRKLIEELEGRVKELEVKDHAGTTGHIHVGEMLDRLLGALPIDSGFLISTNRPDCGWLIEDLASGEDINIYENGKWHYSPGEDR